VKVIFAYGGQTETPDWTIPLQQALPEIELFHWQPDAPAQGAQAAIVWNPPRGLLGQEPGVKTLFNLGAGVDALLRLEGLRDDIQLVRLEDAGMAVQMAEYAAHALIRAARAFDRYEGFQKAAQWCRLPNIRRKDWPVGVLGMGVMGKRVAQVLAALEYPVAGWSRSAKSLPGVTSFSGDDGLRGFLARTRVLVNTLPLTDETRDFLSRETLGQLLPGAYLINMARGEHLVEEDLLDLLDSGHMSGATLDVFRTEPLPPEHPFWQHPGITVTPHVAAASLREESVAQVAQNIRRLLKGEPLEGVVSRRRGY
jgi:glyoxylate/hydroxypyruvate reductase A